MPTVSFLRCYEFQDDLISPKVHITFTATVSSFLLVSTNCRLEIFLITSSTCYEIKLSIKKKKSSWTASSLLLLASEPVLFLNKIHPLYLLLGQKVLSVQPHILTCFSPFCPHLNVLYHSSSSWHFINYRLCFEKHNCSILLELFLLSKIYLLVVLF